ncbi:MAG: acetate uptake transporter [Pseudomonadota bacterium]
MRNIWSDEGDVRADVPLEKIHEAEMWRSATVASPVPLGLIGFATATFILGFVMAAGGAVVAAVPVLLLFGGLTQWVMSFFALRKGSTLAATVFGTYGTFYLAYAMYVLYAAYWAPAGQLANIGMGLGVFLFLIAFITLYLMLSAVQSNVALAAVLGTLFLGYLCLGMGYETGGMPLVSVWFPISGWILMISGLIAYYASFAVVFNSAGHRAALPIGARGVEEVHTEA